MSLKAKRELSYVDAEREIFNNMMQNNKEMVMFGQGINDENAMFGITTGLYKKFGKERVFDTPISENALMGIAIGIAISGMDVVYMHNRPDFLLLAMDQIVNHASKYSYMSGGQICVPLVIWAVTGQGWGSAAQHSQSIQGILMQIPGLKIVMPTTPYDAKGLLKTAIEDRNPVIFLEHRRLFNQNGHVPLYDYNIPFGKGIIKRKGTDVTVIAISAMILDAIEAAEELEKQNISVEIIDLRTIKPYDKELIISSAGKTKRVVIVDTAWELGSVAKEISDYIYSQLLGVLKHKIEIVALPNVPTPASYILEEEFYNDKTDIIDAVRRTLEIDI